MKQNFLPRATRLLTTGCALHRRSFHRSWRRANCALSGTSQIKGGKFCPRKLPTMMVVVTDGHFLFQKSGELKSSKIALCKCIQLIRIAVGNYAISFFHGLRDKTVVLLQEKTILYCRSVIPNHSEPRDIGDVVKLRWKDVKDVRQFGRFLDP